MVTIFTVEELAVYLRIPKSTLYKLAQEGRLPAQKVGRHWRFRKEAIDKWLESGEGSDERPEKDLNDEG